MAFLGREQPVVSAPAGNVRLVCRVCNLLLTVWAGRATINILPDDILLHVFLIDGQEDHYVPDSLHSPEQSGLEDYDRVRRLPWRWYRFVHVCRRWRSIVFAFPIFLDLRLVYGLWTRIELTDIWPPLPIIITNLFDRFRPGFHMDGPWTPARPAIPNDFDFDAAIMHPNRVREIRLFYLTRSIFQRLVSATQMQEQFPALAYLVLHCDGREFDSHIPALPDGFLGGSAPFLQSLWLESISFPALPKFLLSATHLVRLILQRIPHSGYFSSEAIVTGLAGMPNLESLSIQFDSPLSRPHQDSRRLPPPACTVLPALTQFKFKGVSEYLEDFVVRIDAPLLQVDTIYIIFFHQLIYDIPRLAQFMGRMTRFQEVKEAHVRFHNDSVHVCSTLPPISTFDRKSGLEISCRTSDWQLSSVAQVFTSFFLSIYMVNRLYIYDPSSYKLWAYKSNDIDDILWLEIFHPFTGVNNLYISNTFASSIARALQELVGGRTMEVLPNLQSIFLAVYKPSEPIPEGIQNFVAARQLSGHPITVSIWERVG